VQSGAGALIRLNANESSFGPGPAARRAIDAAIADANRYAFRGVPELERDIASAHGVSSSHVLCGAGSGGLLDAIVAAFTSESSGIVTASPTFESPANHARALGRGAREVPVDASGRLDLDAMLAAAAGAGLVYLCNPNNPTGTVHGGADVGTFLDAVLARDPRVVVLVDEAYHDFVALPAYRSFVDRAAADARVIVTRTFSKVHGMAGLRVGYAVGHPTTLAALRPWTDPLNLNVIGLAAARASLADTAYVAERRAVNADERATLKAAFDRAGYGSFDSHANFLMVHVRRDPRSFAAACFARGVHVGRPFPPLLEHARITIGTPEEMARATPAFLEVLAEPASTPSAWAPVPHAAGAC
jgi:histidinol-phosphate aminotransferase